MSKPLLLITNSLGMTPEEFSEMNRPYFVRYPEYAFALCLLIATGVGLGYLFVYIERKYPIKLPALTQRQEKIALTMIMIAALVATFVWAKYTTTVNQFVFNVFLLCTTIGISWFTVLLCKMKPRLTVLFAVVAMILIWKSFSFAAYECGLQYYSSWEAVKVK